MHRQEMLLLMACKPHFRETPETRAHPLVTGASNPLAGIESITWRPRKAAGSALLLAFRSLRTPFPDGFDVGTTR